jgi:hypothetical protein
MKRCHPSAIRPTLRLGDAYMQGGRGGALSERKIPFPAEIRPTDPGEVSAVQTRKYGPIDNALLAALA